MTILSILLISGFCAAWILVICASALARTADLIDNESDGEGQA